MDFFSIGIDIGGTNISWGIVNRQGEVMHNYNWATREFVDLTTLALRIKSEFTALYSIDQLDGIGIGAPAAQSDLGIINNSSNLPWKGIVPIVEIFQNSFKVTVKIENDARAAAWGEKIYGDAKHIPSYAFVTLGTGVGCGIVLSNNLLIGDNHFAGEIGHIIIERNGRLCGCGRQGCLETYISASGIVKTYKDLSSSNTKATSSKDIFELYLSGDKNAEMTFDITAEYLSLGISQLLTILGIQHIFLFGGPTAAGKALTVPLEKQLQKNLLHLINKNYTIHLSKMSTHQVAILGAASLIY